MADAVVAALRGVYDPCCRDKGVSVVDMGLLHDIRRTDGHLVVELVLTSGWCPFASRLLTDVQEAAEAVPGVTSATVELLWDEIWSPARMSPAATAALRFLPDPSDTVRRAAAPSGTVASDQGVSR